MLHCPQPGQYEENNGDPKIAGDAVDPHFRRQRLEEGEETGRFLLQFLVQDADAQVHEGKCEVYRSLSLQGYRQVSYGHVSFLQQ